MNTNANTQSDDDAAEIIEVRVFDKYLFDPTDIFNPVVCVNAGSVLKEEYEDPNCSKLEVVFEDGIRIVDRKYIIVVSKLDRSYHREYNTAL